MKENIENKEIIEKQRKTENRIIEIYLEIQKRLSDKKNNLQIENIIYFEQLEIVQAKDQELDEKQSENIINGSIGGINLSEVYVVQVSNKDHEKTYEIYDDDMKIADINADGKIQFSEKYREMLLKVENGMLFIREIENLESSNIELKEIQEQENDIGERDKNSKVENKRIYTKEDLDNLQNKQSQDNEKKEEEKTENKERDDEEQKEVIAQKMGMEKSNILSCEKIPPHSFVTETESFEEIAGVKGKYKEIFVVAVNHRSSENKKFAFFGINENGETEEIPELTTRGATTTDRSIYAMNKNGSVVEEKQATQIFNTGDPYKNISITMGDYGKIEVEYLRKSVEGNKWIGSPVETSKQERVQGNVRRNMDENITSKYDITEEIENAEHQLGRGEKEGELSSKQTRLENIDIKEGNEKYKNYDEEIVKHDGEKTTIRKESEKNEIAVEEYVKLLEMAEGDCLADKIQNTNQELQEEKDIEDREIGERERLTPEETALEEEYRKQFYNMKNNM